MEIDFVNLGYLPYIIFIRSLANRKAQMIREECWTLPDGKNAHHLCTVLGWNLTCRLGKEVAGFPRCPHKSTEQIGWILVFRREAAVQVHVMGGSQCVWRLKPDMKLEK